MLWPERSTWGPEEARVGGFAAPGVADPGLNPNRTYCIMLLALCFRFCRAPPQPTASTIVQYGVDKSLTVHISE